MSAAGAPPAGRRIVPALAASLGRGRGRPAALVLLMLLLVLPWLIDAEPLRRPVFDAYQRWRPRPVEALPVAIVAVDQQSLERFGQWPWPRTQLGRLLERIAALGPLAIGLDMVMSEPDRLSPAGFSAGYPDLEPELRQRLEKLRSTDELLADTISGLSVPVVVGRAGIDSPNFEPPPLPLPQTPILVRGPDPLPRLQRWKAPLASLATIDKAAAGRGYVNYVLEPDGVVRRLPLVLAVGDTIAPSLAVELLRVAIGADGVIVHADGHGVTGISIGRSFIPTDPGGSIRIHFSPPNPARPRRYSAAAVLAGEVPAGAFADRVALVGVTALGLGDEHPTPVATRMAGVEIQAQIVENILAGSRLIRPAWAKWSEVGALALAGLGLIAAVPRLRPALSLIPLLALLAAFGGASLAAFANARLLLDPLYPAVATLSVFAVLSVAAWIEADRRRRRLVTALEQERLETARFAGELNAARQIQMAMLPDPTEIVRLPSNLTLHAVLEPATEVGGDFYDTFMLDDHRLFFLVGDVSGKGVPAALFMALSKALCRHVALRNDVPLDHLISTANAEIAGENPSRLFVTVVAGILDARSGALDYCIAGHPAPLRLRPGHPPQPLDSPGGPPLCALDEFAYPSEQARLEPGDLLVLTSDGVTDAIDPDGRRYGRERLYAFLARAAATEPRRLIADLYDDVKRFEQGAPPTDDITILTVRYRAPS